MTTRQTEMVKASWQHIAELDAVIVGHLFYTRLFEAHPEVKHLFKSPVPEQSKKLLYMISYVIARLDKLEDIMEDVQRLAQRHVRYGVKEMHYEMVGAALIWTLQKGLADTWNKELEEAWITCYRLLSSAMIDASQEAALA